MDEQTTQPSAPSEPAEVSPQASVPGTAPGSDAEKNKGMAILAYIIFFIPLLAAKDSKFAMYHANQGLLLFLLAIAINVIGMIPVIGLIVYAVGWVLVLVLAIMGILNAAKGEMKPLPIIGNYTLLK